MHRDFFVGRNADAATAGAAYERRQAGVAILALAADDADVGPVEVVNDVHQGAYERQPFSFSHHSV